MAQPEQRSNDVALRVWVLTDGKIGDDVQCLAVADGLAGNFEKRVIAPRAPWSWFAPWGPIDPGDQPDNAESPIAGAPPDIVIASGRRAIPYAAAVRKVSGGKSKIVILKDPRFGRAAADVIWAPDHDRLSGGNVFSTLTSPHALERKRNDANRTRTPAANLPKPLLGVILGGPSAGARYGDEEANSLASQLNEAAKDFASIAITPSRRTPKEFLTVLREQVAHKNKFVWNGEGENPYLDILDGADALIVAADSHNMMSEALSAGTGVYAWRPPGLAKKLEWFVSQLEERGAVHPFERSAKPFHSDAIDATPDIVAEIKKRLFRT